MMKIFLFLLGLFVAMVAVPEIGFVLFGAVLLALVIQIAVLVIWIHCWPFIAVYEFITMKWKASPLSTR
jgi:hypothetical protein